jgi:predicted ATPase with chaperone activity
MLAKRIPTILPPMSLEEAIETTRIHSVAGVLEGGSGLVGTRPYRSPHHTISDAGLIGGGAVPRPGEATRSRVNFFMNKFRKLGFIQYDNGGLQVHSALLSVVLHE